MIVAASVWRCKEVGQVWGDGPSWFSPAENAVGGGISVLLSVMLAACKDESSRGNPSEPLSRRKEASRNRPQRSGNRSGFGDQRTLLAGGMLLLYDRSRRHELE